MNYRDFNIKIAVSSSPVGVVEHSDERVRDTFESAGFVLNQYGYVRNDFQILLDSNSQIEMSNALARMREMASKEPDNRNKSFKEIVSIVKPRWVSTPSDMDRFEKYLIEQGVDEFTKIKEDLEAKKKAEDEKLAYEKSILEAASKLGSSTTATGEVTSE